MIKKNNKWLRSSLIITTFFIFTLLVLFGGISSEYVYADGIDSIVFEVNGEYIQASMDDWAAAFYQGEGNALYDYISPISVISFESAGVYYDFGSYAQQFYLKDGVFADAIAQTEELDPEIVDKIKFWPILEAIVEAESKFEMYRHEEVLLSQYFLTGELKVSDEVYYLEFAGDERDWARPDKIDIDNWEHVVSDNDFFIVQFTEEDDLRVEDVNANVVVTALDKNEKVIAEKAIPIEGI